jgi:thioredoxin reductase (NADPH)
VTSPVILAVDGDPEALERIAAELRRRYGSDYRIVCETGPKDALVTLEEMHEAGDDVALVLADQACVDLLERTLEIYPRAKRGLLIPWGGWSDDETTAAIREAMLYGRIDYYVLQPSAAPDEYFHRTICELLLEWQRSDPEAPREVTVVADPEAPKSHEIRNLLSRNGVPYAFHACDSDAGRTLLAKSGRTPDDAPVVFLVGGQVLEQPSKTQLAEGYGVPTQLEKHDYELVVVGAGPAGLAAAVYASSEGIDALVVERATIGGQASSSARIRNYLGFPRGLSGAELAQRAYQQAWVFGTSFLLTKEVSELRRDDGRLVFTVSDGSEIRAEAVVLAMGIAYRQIDIPALSRLANRGVFYGMTPGADAQTYAGKDVVIVGGGNSAGQAAVHLARYAAHVTLVVRGPTLAASMSQYLRDEMAARENIVVRCSTSVVDAEGDDRLERLHLRGEDGRTESVPADGLFVLIGAHPHSDWLPDDVVRDEGGYVVTDEDLGDAWPLERHPFMFETSAPGVFAVGDVRSRSVKRVAAAVGEGSVVIQQVYRYLEARSPRVTVADAS